MWYLLSLQEPFFCPWTQMRNRTVHLTHSFLSLVGLRASTIWAHLDLPWAMCCASPHVMFMSVSSTVTVHLQVVLDCTCLHFPGVVHFKASLSNALFSVILYSYSFELFLWRSCQFSWGIHCKKKNKYWPPFFSTRSHLEDHIWHCCCRICPPFSSCTAFAPR